MNFKNTHILAIKITDESAFAHNMDYHAFCKQIEEIVTAAYERSPISTPGLIVECSLIHGTAETTV